LTNRHRFGVRERAWKKSDWVATIVACCKKDIFITLLIHLVMPEK
jgi:hypothetical protein